MNIYMKTCAAGPDGVLYADREYKVSESFGHALVCGGYASEVAANAITSVVADEEEQAALAPVVERAVARGKRGKR